MKANFLISTVVFFSQLFTPPASAQICSARKSAKVGHVQSKELKEASGLAFSRLHPGRLYHINDSGSSPSFFISKTNGTQVQLVTVTGPAFKDTEDMAVGPCPVDRSCLVIGDIGDNDKKRTHIQFHYFKESKLLFAARGSVSPDMTLEVKYPDEAHNAEAFFLDPKGNLFLITKEIIKTEGKSAGPAFVFYIRAENVLRYFQAKQRNQNHILLQFEFLKKIDIPKILANQIALGQLVTGADQSSDGTSISLMTYTGVLEISTQAFMLKDWKSWKKGTDYTFWPILAGLQQEALAYQPGSKHLLLSSENKSGLAPLVGLVCQPPVHGR